MAVLNAIPKLTGKVLLFVTSRPTYSGMNDFADLAIENHPNDGSRASQVVVCFEEAVASVVTFSLDVEGKSYTKRVERFNSGAGDMPWDGATGAAQVWAHLDRVKRGRRVSSIADASE